jgi:hypothetical protein
MLARRAHQAVHVAVQNGRLSPATSQACADCGTPAFGYDHRDYAQPLDVAPVCRRCNRKRGRAINCPTGVKRLTVELDEDDYASLKAMAEEEARSMHAQILYLIRTAFQKKARR